MSKRVTCLCSLFLALALAGCGSYPQTTTHPSASAPSTDGSSSPSSQSEASSAPIAPNPSVGETSVRAAEPGEQGVSAGSCVELYSPENLKQRAFAFDGTITAIELRDDPVMAGGHEGEAAKLPWVTFQINQWYRGGSNGEVSVWLPGLQTSSTTSQITSIDMISADVGTRLLVAGEAIGVGNAPEQGIAWSCGFTQPYTPETAAEWQSATQ